MTLWARHDIEDKIREILTAVPTINDVHHFGRPYISAYQLAIEFERRFGDAFTAIGKPLGGRGTGQHDSLAQYLALELSKKIRDNPSYFVQGAFLSNIDAREIVYADMRGHDVHSSLVGTDFDLSLFRLRP